MSTILICLGISTLQWRCNYLDNLLPAANISQNKLFPSSWSCDKCGIVVDKSQTCLKASRHFSLLIDWRKGLVTAALPHFVQANHSRFVYISKWLVFLLVQFTICRCDVQRHLTKKSSPQLREINQRTRLKDTAYIGTFLPVYFNGWYSGRGMM